ncbi:MAG: PAS domain S-box protein [Thermodesulfobacteriota bacterium]
MVTRRPRSSDRLMAGLVAAWLVLAGAGFLLAAEQEHVQFFFGLSLIFPVLLASFHFGRAGGLMAALAASLACGSVVLHGPSLFSSPHDLQSLALVLVFNAAALVTSWLSDREREARRRYQGLFAGVPVGLYRSARNGRILEANPAMAQLLGFPDSGSLLGQNMADFYESAADRERIIARFGSEDRVMDFESRFRRRDGSVILVRNRCRAERDAEGAIVRFHGSLEDVTEQVRAEEEVRAVRARLENIIEFLPDATFVVDAGRRVIAWNQAMVRMTGIPKERILGRGEEEYAIPFYGERRPVLLDLLWAEDPGVLARYRGVERQGDTLVAESFAPALWGGRGVHVWATATPLRDAAGRLVGAIECVRDITARKEAEKALAESEEKYRGIVENASEGIFQATPDGLIIGANPALARILGYSSGQHMVDSLVDFRRLAADPLDAEADFFFDRVWRMDEVRRGQVRLRRADGFPIWAQVSARASLDGRGAPLIEGFLQDVTAAREAQELLANSHGLLERRVAERTAELEEANQRLRTLDQVKSSFLSLASHELRTPLTSVLGFAKLIRKSFCAHFLPRAGEDAEQALRGGRILGNLDIILGEGERLTRLVNDLLDLSKIESGSIEWRDADLDMPRLLRNAMETLRGQVGGKSKVRLAADIPDRLPRVKADRDRIMQVLANLLGNAAKFTVEGSIRLEAAAVNGWVEVRVRDTGPGIPDADLENVFQKFFQVRDGDTLRDKPKGTGLGLTICRQVVEHYGGQIWAESAQGQGATFVFRLPAAKG